MTKIKICCPTAMPSLWNFLHQYVPRPLYFRRNYLVAMPWLPLWRLVLFGLIATIWWKWLLAIAAQVTGAAVIWHCTTRWSPKLDTNQTLPLSLVSAIQYGWAHTIKMFTFEFGRAYNVGQIQFADGSEAFRRIVRDLLNRRNVPFSHSWI